MTSSLDTSFNGHCRCDCHFRQAKCINDVSIWRPFEIYHASNVLKRREIALGGRVSVAMLGSWHGEHVVEERETSVIVDRDKALVRAKGPWLIAFEIVIDPEICLGIVERCV